MVPTKYTFLLALNYLDLLGQPRRWSHEERRSFRRDDCDACLIAMNDTNKSKQYRSYDVDETVDKFLADRNLQRQKSLQNLNIQRTPRIVSHLRLERPSSANAYSQKLNLRAQNGSRRGTPDVDDSGFSANRIHVAYGSGSMSHAPLATAHSEHARYDPRRCDNTPDASFGTRQADSLIVRSENTNLENRLKRNERRRKSSTMKSFRQLLRTYFGLNATNHKKELSKTNRAHLPDTMGDSSSDRIYETYRTHERPALSRRPSFAARDPNFAHYDRSSVAYARQKSASCMTLAKRRSNSDYVTASSSGSEELRTSKPTERMTGDLSGSGLSNTNNDGRLLTISNNTSAPCLRGISNLGNTCYINSVLQCLSACSYLTDYFLSNKFLKDLHDKTRAQLENCHQYGTGGLLTMAFADMIKSLWSNDMNERIARDFHEVVRQFNREYGTFQQQDAQEFLIWLLDKIHEDLNTAIVRLYKDILVHGSEKDVAECTRNNHLQAHCSIIVILFTAQFRSSIHCQRCHMEALRFDPYMCVSLQVPQELRRPLYVTVAHASSKPIRLVRYGIFVDRSGRLSDVNECISAAVKIPTNRLVMCELNGKGFCTLMPTWAHVERLRSNSVTAVEIPQPSQLTYLEPTELVQVIFLIAEVYTPFEHKTKQRFPQPFACVLPRQSSFDEICAELFSAMRSVLRESLGEHLRSALAEFVNCRICVASGCEPCEELNHLVSMPFYTEVVERAITANQMISETNMAILQLCVEVTQSFMLAFMVPQPEQVLVDQSSDILRESSQSTPLTLTECLDFSSPECIEWKCENCGMNEGEKILKFRSLPPVLVFHLKRFRQMEDGSMIKLDRAIHFPVEGLDMSPYVLSCGQTSNGVPEQRKADNVEAHNTVGGATLLDQKSASLSKSDVQRMSYTNDDCIYDLFAVVHHIGNTVNSGHYTASARNVVDAKWRSYDDHFVHIADPKQIAKCSNAYLLFYGKRVNRKQRRHIPSDHKTGESVEYLDRLSIAVPRNPSPSASNASGFEQSPRAISGKKTTADASDDYLHYANTNTSSVKSGITRTIQVYGPHPGQSHSTQVSSMRRP
ncbi:Ubiquitin carboxyl-terminal hydrolase 31 [Toxocara canis]|uniref:ubiquitinyl hydrolase 1 n=1 Tax=Toxocara canis TaxID=6265 RepID=A0A0B2VLF7_TOXCA|nr:Ubiquitin carboxyl-terminal hydrolase 31 [Toxocara canis]